MKVIYKFFMLWSLTVFSAQSIVMSQGLTLPDVSQEAKVVQRIGIADVTIHYHRPAVKGRPVWGELVPYGLTPGVAFGSGNPFPWRAGANENTKISFTHDVKIEGKPLAAGTYGLHMIPSEREWIIIFSNNSTSWGSFYYDEKEDALRVTATPEEAPHTEFLFYGFDSLTDSSMVAYLQWEKLKVPFKISLDMHKIVLDNIRQELRSQAGFGWLGRFQAANYLYQQNIELEEALGYVNGSIVRGSNINNMDLKANILEKLGRNEEAAQTRKQMVQEANEAELNNYGYQLLGQNKIAEAIDIFKLNVKRYPDSWNVYDSLGEGLKTEGKTKDAIKNYEMALKKAPENQHERISGILEELKSAN